MAPLPPELRDTTGCAALDRLTRLAAGVLDVPVVLVALVQQERQIFLSCASRSGPWSELPETPLSHSLCRHVVERDLPLVVSDTRSHPLTRDCPAIQELGVEAYAGVPLRGSGGAVLGSFCAIDHRPRLWNEREVEVLEDLAASVVTEMEQREAERTLRQSEERYRGLVEAASDIIYNTNPAGYFTYVNPVASQIIGLPAEVLVGTHYTDLIREDAREEARAFYMQQLVDRTPTSYYEFPVATPDGREVWIGQNLQLTFRGNVVVGTQAVARDITERREMARMKDEFISLVSHELRTPLTSLRGALGLVASGKFGLLDARGQQMLDVATRNAERLSHLVSSILDVQRMEAGRLHLERRTVELATVMEDAAASVRAAAEAAQVRLYVCPLFTQLSADPDRLLQALVNLLGNAIKFSPADSNVWITAEHCGDQLHIVVTDEGRGIPADKLEVIFERFRQADLSDARPKDGSGLGLPIARSIVEQHGGRLLVESEVGRGSRFTVVLPVGE